MEKKENIEVVNIGDLIQDSHNFNKGTAEGQKLMEQSFRELGAGRSVLVDKNDNIIAGNKSQLAAIAAGIKKVRVIETDGTELVAVKRTDIDIDSAEGRRLAFLDNLTTQVNLAWDDVELQGVADRIEGFDPSELGIDYISEKLSDDKFEEDFERAGKDDAVYPIIPKFDEKYELFIIVSENEVDANYLREVLNMQKMKSYKSGKLMKSNVVHIKDVIHKLKNRDTQPQKGGQSVVEETGD